MWGGGESQGSVGSFRICEGLSGPGGVRGYNGSRGVGSLEV